MIEKSKEIHIDRIMEIWLRANLSAHSFIPNAFWHNAFDFVKEAMQTADVFVYHENSLVMGFIGITDGGYIAGLFVDEAYRSHGIGRKLLAHCKTRYPQLRLDVFTENTAAVRFYLNNGFQVKDKKLNSEFKQEEYEMTWHAAKAAKIV